MYNIATMLCRNEQEVRTETRRALAKSLFDVTPGPRQTSALLGVELPEEFSDDFILRIPALIELDHEILSRDPDDIMTMWAVINRLTDTGASEADVRKTISHETEHGDISTALGATVYYGTEIQSLGQEQIAIAIPREFEVPLLGYAAISVYPEEPSEFDIEFIKALGYKGVDEVTEKIEEWNTASRAPFIPMPLSAS